ncbi:hypothetical protein PM082_005654 [Marasmius tenuissimus]|nr:hypothetical protein PM082_005654 [Marasmius tenuissimus]
MNDKSPESILAQSEEFDIVVGDCEDGQNMSSAHSMATPYVAQGQAKISTAASSTSSLHAATTVSNKARNAGPINPYIAGLCASLAVLGAFLV